jgi:hypothetical protein
MADHANSCCVPGISETKKHDSETPMRSLVCENVILIVNTKYKEEYRKFKFYFGQSRKLTVEFDMKNR